MSRDQITVERVVPEPANAISDLLADPERHLEIDGSGSVQRSRGGSRRLRPLAPGLLTRLVTGRTWR